MDRTVTITGSSRGIGLETAAEFLKDGDRVVIFCRHKDHVKEATDYLRRVGDSGKILGLVGDVRRARDVKGIVARTLSAFGRIDLLVNNAGIAAYKELVELTEKEWDDILDTNLKGTFLFMREVLPIMKQQAAGVVVNVSSALGLEGESNFSAYCASKFGVIGLTQSAADETAASGVRVYAVLPWAVKTKLNADLGLGMSDSELLQPRQVAEKIFHLADGKKRSGELIRVHL